MNTLEFTTTDRVLAKLAREHKSENLNETDIIEWIGEALDFMQVANSLVERVVFITVTDYHADFPCGFQSVLQIARHNNWNAEASCSCADLVPEVLPTTTDVECPVTVDCQGKLLGDVELAYYRPYFDLKYEYELWSNSASYRENFTPVRLANNTFFNSIVCKPKEIPYNNSCNGDEYTIVGDVNRKLRFSFSDGLIALAYLATPLDEETGYPLVPVNISYVSAITYYVKWKIAEGRLWDGREGAGPLSQRMEERWLKYCRQAKNYARMPKGVDQYQNLLESSFDLIPNHKKYYGFFGSLGRPQDKRYNDPDFRNR